MTPIYKPILVDIYTSCYRFFCSKISIHKFKINLRTMMKTMMICVLSIFLLHSCANYTEHDKTKTEAENLSLKDVARYVNPFIGTDYHGHTFPGACLPHGMVQLSPDTRTLGWDACSGYHFSDTSILGFSHTHLSGTGIGDYGDFLFMPFTGEVKTQPGAQNDPDSGYQSRFTKSNEIAKPGYYAVKLDDYNILVELTTTLRTGIHSYTFPKAEKAGVIIDLAHTIHGHQHDTCELKIINDREIAGYKKTKGWARDHKVYFHAIFSKPFSVELVSDQIVSKNKTEISGKNIQAKLNFSTAEDEKVMVKVGISPVDMEGALKNIESEANISDFEGIKNKAYQTWNEQLSVIDVNDASQENKEIFYTALYHAFIAPHIYSDVDGRYRGIDQQIYTNTQTPNYTVFSLWDTFRALHPLLNIIDPALNEEFVRILLQKYDEGGTLPKWELASNYTGTMIGYHAVPVIVDAYMKGNQNFDTAKALKAMIEASNYDPGLVLKNTDEDIQKKLNTQAKYYNQTLGFIPADKCNESVSKALEYAYNDWCIAVYAQELGKTGIAEEYFERANRYKDYFERKTKFMRGKNSDGLWREPFDPKFSRHRRDDYTEGNAWQWLWFVPHDVEGLIELLGGQDFFTDRLDSLFTSGSELKGDEASVDITGLIGQYAHGNEPSHHTAHLYNFSQKPYMTQVIVDSIMSNLYTNKPDGLCGNEDCGQMSAWFILNAMGFYPVCPGNTTYSIGRPMFKEVSIKLDKNNMLMIKTENNSRENKYVQHVEINGKKLDTPFFDHKDIEGGGVIQIKMGDRPVY